MKTFNQLTIGDTFYKVYTNYEGEKSPTVKSFTVRSIFLENNRQDVQILKINKSSGHSSDYCDFERKFTECNSDMAEAGNDGYFTTNIERVNELLTKAALNYIKQHEEKIASEKKDIVKIRIAYWDYLNNTGGLKMKAV